ncbi:MAG: hypothetical protein KDE14_12585 [Rhodobacteraceae bacterium]|nr:hypothetical protein [Paracoccaceae bacterium]
MDSTYAKRLLIASVFGAGATVIVFAIAAGLNGAFFGDEDTIAVTRCYFTDPAAEADAGRKPWEDSKAIGCLPAPEEENGMVAFFNRFMRQQDESPPLPAGRYDRSARPQ